MVCVLRIQIFDILLFCRQSAAQPGVDLFVGGQDLFRVLAPLLLQLLRQSRVLHRQDLDGKQGGIDSAIHGYSCHRDTGGHLHCGQKRVNAVQCMGLDGDADDGQGGAGGQGAGQVGGHTGGGDDDAEAAAAGGGGKGPGLAGGAVGGIASRVSTALPATPQSLALPMMTATFFIQYTLLSSLAHTSVSGRRKSLPAVRDTT